MVLQQGQLSQRVRQNLSIIQAGVSRGLSATSINDLVRQAQGTGIRRVELLAGIRQVKGIAEAGLHVQNIRKDRLPDPSRIPFALTPILSQYSFTVRLRGEDRATGELTDTFLTVRSNSLMTREEIEAEAQAALDEADSEAYGVGFEGDVEITVVGARQRAR